MDFPWFIRLWQRSNSSLEGISPSDFVGLIGPKCKQIVTEEELIQALSKKRKLSVKLGIDTTGDKIHLGHAVPLMLLRMFARAGHEIHFVIGDFTGQIGDPSGRTQKRAELSAADIKKNMKTYKKQISSLINVRKAKIHKNSEWLSKMSLADFFKIIGAISFSQVAQRDDFRNRMKAGIGVTLREANYAALMAIDSLHLGADIEVCGIDQLLNTMQARDVLEASGRAPEVILATPIIEGTSGDGRKMSKSFNNFIALGDSPSEQFGLIMSIPDSIVESYFISFGDIYSNEVKELSAYIKSNPLEAKKELGMLIVALLHGEEAAIKARGDFERRFSKRNYAEEDETRVELKPPVNIVDGLFEAFSGETSKTKIRAMIAQGGVHKISDGKRYPIVSASYIIEPNDCIKVGKLRLFRFIIK